MKNIFILHHLGLGDCIIMNGAYRKMAESDIVLVPTYKHNEANVSAMFADCRNIKPIVVYDDDGQRLLAEQFANVVKIGHWCNSNVDPERFDMQFYRQIGMPLSISFDNFKWGLSINIKKYTKPYSFVGNMCSSGVLPLRDLPPGNIIDSEMTKEIPMAGMLQIFIDAEELHMVSSSQLALACRLPCKAKRKVFHQYARKPAGMTLPSDWEVWT